LKGDDALLSHDGQKVADIILKHGDFPAAGNDPAFYECKAELRKAFPGKGIELLEDKALVSGGPYIAASWIGRRLAGGG
jgi:hypothetical protein